MIALMFCYEYEDFSAIQPFNIYTTFLRIIATLLLTMKYTKDLYTATKMLSYLKKVKTANGRFINIMLCSMQILVPLVSVVALLINIT